MQRLIAGMCCFIAFLVMASVMAPAPSQGQDHATGEAPSAHGGDDAPSADAHAGLVQLGSVEDRAHLIRIYQTDLGPRYSIYERDTMRELGTLLSLDQSERFFPDLPLRRLLADDGSALMLAAPRDGMDRIGQ
jgi:hypothetical protein